MEARRYGVVMVTAVSRQEAETIARTLVQAHLAACVSLLPIHSIYTWQGEVHQEDEWQLLIKCDLTKFEAIEAKVRQVHSYEVPEIIALPILAGSKPYLDWISEQVQGNF
ncbi:divalent-cation tolerance protein CutA [Kovacikia minuta CCNUW1]|nr:divalent-cation tolerance protein CutA [Kovacikia minuta]UBF29539.1 divalent-cation tolerance protein CutA [Kovacikia minuta CCNUW1]